jgi:hypothetical protein
VRCEGRLSRSVLGEPGGYAPGPPDPGVLETLARYARLLVSVPFNLRGGVGSPHKALAIKYRAGGRSPAGY